MSFFHVVYVKANSKHDFCFVSSEFAAQISQQSHITHLVSASSPGEGHTAKN